jgi:hypothetical protein
MALATPAPTLSNTMAVMPGIGSPVAVFSIFPAMPPPAGSRPKSANDVSPAVVEIGVPLVIEQPSAHEMSSKTSSTNPALFVVRAR